METDNKDWQNPMNDGENQGHHWERHHQHESSYKMSDKEENDNDDSEDEEEENHVLPEWGDVDPQDRPGPAGPMDPSGPGSAV